MRIVRPIPAPDPRNSGVGRRASRPQWLKEWIGSKVQYALLSCGHVMDVNPRYAVVIKTFGNRHVSVFCEKHNRFAEVKRKLSLMEYHRLTVQPIPEEPLF